MESQQILALYDWQKGLCFRHPARGTQETAHIKTIRPPAGGLQDVRACAECVLQIEDAKERAASRSGERYRPGRLSGASDAD